jgi:hypothetical protein
VSNRLCLHYVAYMFTVTGKMASTLMTWERKILRKIYGPKSEQGVWRIRSNLEIQNMYKSPDILTEISQKTGMVVACRQNGRHLLLLFYYY